MGRHPRPQFCAILGRTGFRAAGPPGDRSNPNGLRKMAGARRHSVKRDADRSRPLKSWHQIKLPLIGELGRLELSLLLLLIFTADAIVATIVWFVVGSLLR
jgi:hypothetical protein